MRLDHAMPDGEARFRLGINYWPSRTAMGWWRDFDEAETGDDLAKIAGSGFDSVRLFMTWEDFQPTPDAVETGMLDRLITVADKAQMAGLEIMPTLFTGHMSGVNLIPGWALGGSDRDGRFRVVSGGRLSEVGLRNWYSDPEVASAQARLAGEAATALAGHEAIWAWDLGNENSNCVLPPNRQSARDWLKRITGAIRTADPKVLVSIGLHMEDLEEDRLLGPREAARECDFLTMHGYPIYAPWAEGPTDEHVLPFLAALTSWLGRDADVLFSEFGMPTYDESDPSSERIRRESSVVMVEEQAAAAYTERALNALHAAGCMGAMLWCYTDYAASTWNEPPLDAAVHERSFGLWRSDRSAKPAVAAVAAFDGVTRVAAPNDREWLDLGPAEFYATPGLHVPRLYRRYRQRAAATSP
ncbi:MAG: cellulase family glycosylhydrolase [Chloroflexota bacterium]